MKRKLLNVVIQLLEGVLNSPDEEISENNRINLRRAIELLSDEGNTDTKEVLENIRTAINSIRWIKDIIDKFENDE